MGQILLDRSGLVTTLTLGATTTATTTSMVWYLRRERTGKDMWRVLGGKKRLELFLRTNYAAGPSYRRLPMIE
ncbi:uncharacterized protein LY79DRAFT_549520 [Colletotrichum navitas]|uniref:Uncharacterized protein n=1 Tax=Colletotrichum navitas TaxID=681940 RepID=A0AAD8Q2P5_9PEZI|nr:uncharacterized protein LY79DRAFT_549520 [Colletotrichum navitas]KAK1594355.1 hypothetical protein LY79DRAFT_549520 [Colletotrichum navitas]